MTNFMTPPPPSIKKNKNTIDLLIKLFKNNIIHKQVTIIYVVMVLL